MINYNKSKNLLTSAYVNSPVGLSANNGKYISRGLKTKLFKDSSGGAEESNLTMHNNRFNRLKGLTHIPTPSGLNKNPSIFANPPLPPLGDSPEGRRVEGLPAKKNYLISNIDVEGYIKKVREERFISALKKLSQKLSKKPTQKSTISPLREEEGLQGRPTQKLSKKELKSSLIISTRNRRKSRNRFSIYRKKTQAKLNWLKRQRSKKKFNIYKWVKNDLKLKHLLVAKRENLSVEVSPTNLSNTAQDLNPSLFKQFPSLAKFLTVKSRAVSFPEGDLLSGTRSTKAYYLDTLNLYNALPHFQGEADLDFKNIGSKKALCKFVFNKPYPFTEESLQALKSSLATYKTYKITFKTLKDREELLKKLYIQAQVDRLFTKRREEYLNKYIKDIKNFFNVPFLKTTLMNTISPLNYKTLPTLFRPSRVGFAAYGEKPSNLLNRQNQAHVISPSISLKTTKMKSSKSLINKIQNLYFSPLPCKEWKGIGSDNLTPSSSRNRLPNETPVSLKLINQINKHSTKAKFANLYQGLQMKVSGRLKGAQRAKKQQYNFGRISAQTARSFLLSNKTSIFTKWGIYGSTVFISRSS